MLSATILHSALTFSALWANLVDFFSYFSQKIGSSNDTVFLSKLMVTFLKNETYGYGMKYIGMVSSTVGKTFGLCILQ